MLKLSCIFLLMLCCSIACKVQENFTNEHLFSTQYKALKNDKIYEQQLNILEGQWLNTDYLSSIKKEKSLYKAQLLGDYLIFDFNKKQLLKEGKINALNLHEGDDIYIEYKPVDQVFTNVVQSYQDENMFFKIEIVNQQNVMLNYEKQNTKLPFQKMKKDFQYIINELLITGSYLGEREYGKVDFFNNGRVEGFENFKYYRLVFDYVEDYIQSDIILFNQKDDFSNWLKTRVFAIEYLQEGIQLREILLNTDDIQFEYKTDKIIILNKEK